MITGIYLCMYSSGPGHFQEVHQIAEITEEYKKWLRYETHTITDFGIVSTLRMNANISKIITLRCEINMSPSYLQFPLKDQICR